MTQTTLKNTPTKCRLSADAEIWEKPLRRIGEGAAMIRTKGEAGSGNIVEAVRHMRQVQKEMKHLTVLDADELMAEAKNMGAPYDLVQQIAKTGKLPRTQFCRRRSRHPGRCRADDATRCGGSLCGIGNICEWRFRKTR
jgi:pyridoxal biosynthesis lyase PdxS